MFYTTVSFININSVYNDKNWILDSYKFNTTWFLLHIPHISSFCCFASTIHSFCGSESDISKHKSSYVTWWEHFNNHFNVVLIKSKLLAMVPCLKWSGSCLHLCLYSSCTSHSGCFHFCKLISASGPLYSLCLIFLFPFLVCSFSLLKFQLKWAFLNTAVPDH